MTARAVASVVVEATTEQAWPLVVGRDGVTRWWGLLDTDLTRVARQATVRTGSGSFYRLWVERVEPPRLVELTSSYLGVAPATRVWVRLRELPSARVRVGVVEVLATADAAARGLATDLWQARLEVLRHVVEGTPAPGPAADVALRCSLRDPAWRPLHPRNVGGWLPLSGPETPPRWFYVVDELGARPFAISCWQRHYDERLDIGIAVAPSSPASHAQLAVTESDGTVELGVRHTGWDGLHLDGEVRRMLRSRFRATWRHALGRVGGTVRSR